MLVIINDKNEVLIKNNPDLLQDIKYKLINRLWFGSFIIAIIGAPISALRSVSTGWLSMYSMHIGIATLFTIVYFYRHKTSYNIKSLILIIIFALIGILGVFTLGLLGAGIWWLIMSCFLISTLYSVKYGTFALVISAIIISIAGYCFTHEIISIPIDANEYIKDHTSWITLLMATAVMPFFVFQSISSFQYSNISLLNEIERQRIQINKMATLDQLTGLYLLTPANERLKNSMEIARQSNKNVAFLFFDIDGFKGVNDKYGHDAGDEILKQLAQRILLRINDSDTAARIGGDEIVLILSDVEDKESIKNIVQKLIDDLATPYFYLDKKIQITASVGISIFPEHANTAKLLRKKADAAMYSVKKSGKNGIAFA